MASSPCGQLTGVQQQSRAYSASGLPMAWWLVGAMVAREIPNLKVVGSTPTWVTRPSLAQLVERLTVVVH